MPSACVFNWVWYIARDLISTEHSAEIVRNHQRYDKVINGGFDPQFHLFI